MSVLEQRLRGVLGGFVERGEVPGLVGVLFTQVAMTSPVPPKVFEDFWTVTYTSIDQHLTPFSGR
ncbi:hypothetical protein ACIA8R_21150 [Nonomuraea sp. NPDC051191]|uniref:hypothetical protein n=1 Tax=Nonomuraea sp. NPDC051191 TaxID=3364372 RepID=UPI0037A5D284